MRGVLQQAVDSGTPSADKTLARCLNDALVASDNIILLNPHGLTPDEARRALGSRLMQIGQERAIGSQLAELIGKPLSAGQVNELAAALLASLTT